MAKKRKKTDQEREEKEYKAPEFDEREFITEEINIAKATILAAIFSVPMGIAAFMIMDTGGFVAGLMLGILGMVIIHYLMPFAKVNMEIFKPKSYFGVFSTYFFAFLAVWVLMMNPPFTDLAGPQIVDLEIQAFGPANNTVANFTLIENGSVQMTQIDVADGANLSIIADITDNEQIVVSSVTITVLGTEEAMTYALGEFTYTIPNAGPMTVTIDANDVEGNNVSFEFSIV